MTGKDTAELTAYFWNDWKGLIKEKVQVERIGKSVRFTFYSLKQPHPRTSRNIIVPYECTFKML